MKEYKIKINTKNKMIPVNGKIVRTPAEFKVTESQLEFYKTLIRARRIDDFDIEENYGNKKRVIRKRPSNNEIKNENNFRKEKKTLDKYI